MRFSFSTESLVPEERFENFRDTLVRGLIQLDLENRSNEPYRGAVDLYVGGPAIFGQVYGAAAQFSRSDQLAKRCEEGVWVLLNGNGRLKVTQGEFEHELAPGDGIIFDAVHAHTGQCLVESDTWVIQVPDVLLKTLRAADAANNTTLLRKNAAITRMMTSVISAYHTLNDEERAETGFITGQYLADLVALSLGTNRDGTASIEQRGLRAARVQAVFDDIGRHYLSASSSAQDSASRLGISTRYLHLLLERTGKSYSDHVLDRRLVLARRILLDRNKSHMRIIDIAHGCGFADLSYFNRTYRRRFAETPSDTRALSGG